MALCFGERLYGEGWWVKNMVACGGWCSTRTGWGNFFTCISFEVGVGFMVKFQHDSCCGDQDLKEDFPELFHIVSNKEASVVDWQNSDDNILWDVTFFRTVQALELESLTSFMDLIHSTKLGRSGEDKLCWNPSKCRVFEVESY